MSKPPAGERCRLTLRTLPDDTPVAIRLRHVLKGLLRTWGFRAECVEQLQEETEGDPPAITADLAERPLRAR